MTTELIATGTSGLQLSKDNLDTGIVIYRLSDALADGGKFSVSISDPYTKGDAIHRTPEGNTGKTSDMIPRLKECIALHEKGELLKIQMLLNVPLSASIDIASGN